MEGTLNMDQIKASVRRRARAARSKKEVITAMFDALDEAHLDPSGISLENWKCLLVEGMRAARSGDGAKIVL